MNSILQEISSLVREFGSAPTLETMPHRTLASKGIAGPTAAHTIEEVHTPLNLAYLTFTTGTSAFQNIVGVTYAELPARQAAAFKVLQAAGLQAGDELLITYPPLVNVFSAEALTKYGLKWSFLVRSSRDAFLAALYERQPQAILGESMFIKSALEDAQRLGILAELPTAMKILTAGTPLDLELVPLAKTLLQAEVHDLYGCQEFGWLMIDGVPVRDDLEFIPLKTSKQQEMREIVVGGLPMGDSFPWSESGHICNPLGKTITYRRERTYPEYEVVVTATTLKAAATLARVARSILRIKGRIVRVSPNIELNAAQTVLQLVANDGREREVFEIKGAGKTQFFDSMVQAQLDYQQNSKADPVWTKRS